MDNIVIMIFKPHCHRTTLLKWICLLKDMTLRNKTVLQDLGGHL